MVKRPKSYREQKCCGNCMFVFILNDYDSGSQFFCHIDKSKRPKCGSVLMGETWKRVPLRSESDNLEGEDFKRYMRLEAKSFDRYDRLWEKWIKGREVKEFGICDKWKKR